MKIELVRRSGDCQIREPFPEATAPRYLILDRASKYEGEDDREGHMSLAARLSVERDVRAQPFRNGLFVDVRGSCNILDRNTY